jgi:hypothetical protein
MSRARGMRLTLVMILLVVALVWVWRTKIDSARISLVVTAVIGAVTAIYALLTYEILIENQVMAKATSDSSAIMERSLRFSHSPSLIYETVNTTDPTFGGSALIPIDNEDYKRAIATFRGSSERKEFVFAVIKNKGQGAATNLNVETVYKITDSSNLNRESSVTKQASVQILEPKRGVALCIFISKVPTADDEVALVSARLTVSDFYRDAIDEPAQEIDIDISKHHVDLESGCVVRVV